MRKKQLFFNFILLSFTSVVLKFAGMFFKVFLSNTIGAEGMGIYQLIFTVFSLMIAVSCSGVQLASTQLISEQTGKNRHEYSKYIVKLSLSYVLVLSVISGFIVILTSKSIAKTVLKDFKLHNSLKILALAVIPVAMSTCFKGYFTASGKVYKISISQIIEDIIKIGLVVIIFTIYKGLSLEKNIFIVMATILLAEITSCTLLLAMYSIDIRQYNTIKSAKHIKTRFISLVFMLAIGSVIGNVMHALENFLIPISLEKHGISSQDALRQYGMLKGMTIPCLLFPSGLIWSFSSLMMPEVTRSASLNHKRTTSRLISKSLKITLIIAVGIMGLFLCLSNEISQVLYKNSEVGGMLQTLAYFVPFMYIDGIIFTYLTALDLQKSALRITTFDSLMRVILTYVLIPKIGFKGIIIVLYISNLLTPVLGFITLSKKVEININFLWIIMPFLSVFLTKNIFENNFSKLFVTENHFLNLMLNATTIFSLYVFLLSLCLFTVKMLCKQNLKKKHLPI